MNHDRLLTRVYDKQEKKMLYIGDHIDGCRIEGVSNEGIVCFGYDPEIVYYKDRYIPMQCWGLKDIKEKLAYEADIVKYWLEHKKEFIYGVIESDPIDNNLWIGSLGSYPFTNIGIEDCEIIGDTHMQPELLEVKA